MALLSTTTIVNATTDTVADALRVSDGFNLVQHLEIGEVVHKDLVHHDHHDAVVPEPDALHLRAEG
ncbi:hypothetical protein LR48_Vigan01g076000 [Vigna angularis]|uniref:Uncharacterized protein n=1 Tax=Phaseolus angularis TaxID=3914 RepID=A0A0L9TKY0_PHAAN|nr:hypothetical protein LR48_Vigan01g076000 [Vigna angularis]